MADVHHSSREPTFPTEAELRVGRTVMARTTIKTIEADTALVGSWCKRAIGFVVVLDTDGAVDDSGTAATLRYDYRIRWISGPCETHAWVGMFVVADSGQSTPPEVQVELRDAAAAVVDTGCTWVTSDGSLVTSPARLPPADSPLDIGGWWHYGASVGGEQWIETGWQDAGEVADGPRLIELGPPGTLQELRISPLGTRIMSGLILAANRGTIPAP